MSSAHCKGRSGTRPDIKICSNGEAPGRTRQNAVCSIQRPPRHAGIAIICVARICSRNSMLECLPSRRAVRRLRGKHWWSRKTGCVARGNRWFEGQGHCARPQSDTAPA